MGCCLSRPSSPNSPYPGGASNSASAGAINAQPRQSAVAEDAQGHDSMSHGQQSRQSLSQHIDRPLRRHEWTSHDRVWTRTDLDLQRTEFFDTRVTGRPEIWQVLRTALEILWEADFRRVAGLEHDDGTEGFATAQGILRAAEVTLPTGDLANGAYDPLGNYYSLPEWVVSDPSNVVNDPARQTKGDDDLTGDDTHGDDTHGADNAGEGDEDEVLRRREEKGKAVVDVTTLVKIRARLSDDHPDVVITMAADETVRSLARKVAEESGLPSTKRVRVAYMGKILQESMTLQAQGWHKDHLVNALVFDR